MPIYKKKDIIKETVDPKIAFDEEVIDLLIQGGLTKERAEQLLQVQAKWFENAKNKFSADQIVSQLLKYEKNLKEDKDVIDELVNKDGSPIEGDDQHTNTKITVPNGQTTDDFVDATRQGNRLGRVFNQVGIRRENVELQTELDEIAKAKMEGMLEDLVTKSTPNTIVDRPVFAPEIDETTGEIPGLDELKDTFEKPILARKISFLTDMLSNENVNGDEKAIILNHILTHMDLSDVSTNHKAKLKSYLEDQKENGEPSIEG